MDYETRKRNVLGYWMLTHEKLSKSLQEEFLAHPLVEELANYNPRFIQYAIEKQKKALLNEIVEIVREIENQRLELERERGLERLSPPIETTKFASDSLREVA